MVIKDFLMKKILDISLKILTLNTVRKIACLDMEMRKKLLNFMCIKGNNYIEVR